LPRAVNTSGWVPVINATVNRKQTAVPICFLTLPFTAIARYHGVPITRVGTGVFSENLPGNEREYFNGKAWSCRAVRRGNCSSVLASLASIAPLESKPESSFPFTAMSSRSIRKSATVSPLNLLTSFERNLRCGNDSQFSLAHSCLPPLFRGAPSCCKSICLSSAWIE